MANILTPVTLCNSYDRSLDLYPEIIKSTDIDGIRLEKLYFQGRETGDGRVKIAALFARSVSAPSDDCVIIFSNSKETADEELVKYFVKRGYTVLMPDYRGEWEGSDFYTVYPENVAYANAAKCGRHRDYVDESADKTCWYEWAGVGVYAEKLLKERISGAKIAAIGIRDGGEIVWKVAVACSLACIIPVSAAGWLAYAGINKHVSDELKLDDERYRFLGGIDSQAYAPYVKCPVLMLCTTNDRHFDYDRAFDTFSRINAAYAADSSIAYSIHGNAVIDINCSEDMFLFLNKHLKNRQIFIPRPATVNVTVDDKENLVARVNIDDNGVVEKAAVYLAEDSADSALRDWLSCPPVTNRTGNEQDFLLNIYEKTSKIFVICGVKYSSGFTVWSKITVKKISGSFRNMQHRSRVIYSAEKGCDGFMSVVSKGFTLGGIFHGENFVDPVVVEKDGGTRGLYSPCGMATFRTANRRFAPSAGSLLAVDAYADENSEMTFTFTDCASGEEYTLVQNIVGGVWQTMVLDSNLFKTATGATLADFDGRYLFTLSCPVKYAVNNIIWL